MRAARTQRSEVQPLGRRVLLSYEPFGAETTVNLNGASAALCDVAVSGNGSYLIAAPVDGAGTRTLQVQRYSGSGKRVGAALTIHSITGGFENFYPEVSLSASASGTAVVAWTVYNRSTNFASVLMSRISSDGVASAPVLVSDGAVGSVSVSMDDSGGFFIGWLKHRTAKVAREAVLMRPFDSTGGARGATFTAASVSDTATVLSGLKIAAKPDGSGAVFTYMRKGDAPLVRVDYGRASSSARIGNVQHIEHGQSSGLSNYQPAIAANPNGSFEIGYELLDYRAPDPDTKKMFIQRFAASGTPLGKPLEPGREIVGDGTYSVALDGMPDGGFVAAFRHVYIGVEWIFARRYDANGNPDPAGPVQLDSNYINNKLTRGLNGAPAISAGANGETVVTYPERAPGTGSPHYRRVTSRIAAVDKSVLYAFGTGDGDLISVKTAAGQILVTRGRIERRFAATQVLAGIVSGFAGDDTIDFQLAAPSTISGGSGNDTIYGGSGNDSINGFNGDDSLWGNDGHDKLFGERGNDSIFGNGGNDSVEGGLGTDHIRGNAGRDTLQGNEGPNRLFGGEGDDTLFGTFGDELFGEGGDDRIDVRDFGESILHGGAGDDLFLADNLLIDHIFGDDGRDSVSGDSIDVLTDVESVG